MVNKLEAYVLETHIYKTSSLIVRFLTSNSILDSICYKAKKDSKAFGSDLESISKLKLVVYEKEDGLSVLKESSIVRNYSCLEKSIYSSLAVFYIREILSSVAKDFDNRYFVLMEKMLNAMEENEIINAKENDLIKIYINVLIRAFEMKTLYIVGISPNLEECIFCNSRNVEFYSIEDGGMVCKNCIRLSKRVFDMSSKEIEFLKIIKHTSFIDIVKNKDIVLYKDISRNVARDILVESLYFHTSRMSKSLKVLEDII